MSFYDFVNEGNALGALRLAAINGALWAVGSAWATGTREIALTLVPDDRVDKIVAELLATLLVTIFGVSTALFIGRLPCGKRPLRHTTIVNPALQKSTGIVAVRNGTRVAERTNSGRT